MEGCPSSVNKVNILWTIFSFTIIGSQIFSTPVFADPDPLQDFCVADFESAIHVNGYACKSSTNVTTEDFAFAGLAEAANLTGNPFNAQATFGFDHNWPALNTLGLSLVRLDMNPGGVIVPHTHHTATEIIFVLEGEIYTGFVANSDNPTGPNKLFAKVVKKGEAFIFPRGLLHFQLNRGSVPAVSINFLNSQNPGIQLMPMSLFGAGIDKQLLMNSFFLEEAVISKLEDVLTKLA
ncbi:hypothetical protein Mapa_005472 [Marchantia paleacea]|nr:hypothetical protein Mapa_005472 [Marchantia paleacea]